MIWNDMVPRGRDLRLLLCIFSSLVVFSLSSALPAAAQPSEARIKEVTDQLRALQAELQEHARQIKAQQDLYARLQAAQQTGPGATGPGAASPGAAAPTSPV